MRIWRANGDKYGLEIFTGRAWWQVWKAPRIVVWFTRAEAVTLRNLLGGAIAGRVR